jgi:hypothetical protein
VTRHTGNIDPAVNAGLAVQRVEIDGGKIIVFAGRPDNKQGANEWDDVH